MLRNLINTLRGGFATICNGASTLELFPSLAFSASSKLVSQSPSSVPYSLKNYSVQDINFLPRKSLSYPNQDALSLTKDRKQLEADLTNVMRSFPVAPQFQQK